MVDPVRINVDEVVQREPASHECGYAQCVQRQWHSAARVTGGTKDECADRNGRDTHDDVDTTR